MKPIVWFYQVVIGSFLNNVKVVQEYLVKFFVRIIYRNIFNVQKFENKLIGYFKTYINFISEAIVG